MFGDSLKHFIMFRPQGECCICYKIWSDVHLAESEVIWTPSPGVEPGLTLDFPIQSRSGECCSVSYRARTTSVHVDKLSPGINHRHHDIQVLFIAIVGVPVLFGIFNPHESSIYCSSAARKTTQLLEVMHHCAQLSTSRKSNRV